MHWTLLLLILNQHKDPTKKSPLSLTIETSTTDALFELRWNLFQETHFKRYQSHEEHLKRKSIFYHTLLEIEAHNERFLQGLETFEMGINQFSDMTDEEFEAIYGGNDLLNILLEGNQTIEDNHGRMRARPSIEPNWYTPELPVKNQGQCGSCWTFATTGLLEYDYYIKKGEVVSLSEQELLDCVPNMNYGCGGGVPYYALEFVKESGINYEDDYPYKQRKTKCQIRLKKAPKLVQKVMMTDKSEKAIYNQLFDSPIIVGVYLNSKVWKNYKSGYFTALKCKRNKINHAIVILGVVQEGGHKLWYARNSFGKLWGIDGHLKMAMNENTCELGKSPGFYVTVNPQ